MQQTASHFRFKGIRTFLLVFACSVVGLGSVILAGQRDAEEVRQEEQEDYFQKWLDQDVVYLIREEEREVFENLTTPEEKEQFIEQFWRRRDPDLRTAVNEFKEEHYRRIAYANEHFFWSKPGWMTDRGRLYIIHGPPDEIESHPSGGPYDRPFHEGGGSTVTFPFEVWRYRYLEGIGPNIVLEFVDPTMTREYRLARSPEEKDALLTTPGVGLTLAEQTGDAERLDRPYFSHDARIKQGYPGMFQRAEDNPFERYRRYVDVQRAPEIKYRDLKQLVDIGITYENLPFQVRYDYIRLRDDHIILPVTVQIDHKNLTFEQEERGYLAEMAIYGLVTTIGNQIVEEFEHDVRTAFSADELKEGKRRSSIYQKILVLKQKTRHKLDLVVKDQKSGRTGIVTQALDVPAFEDESLSRSSLILADLVQPLPEIPTGDEMFVLGDVRVRPSLSGNFPHNGLVGVYLQIYNASLDQSSLTPSLRVSYRIRHSKDGDVVKELIDEQGESIQFFSSQRVVLIRRLLLRGLDPGDYSVEVDVEDRISGDKISASQTLQIVEAAPRLALRD